MNDDYYVIRCAYKRLLKGKVHDAINLLYCWMKWKQDNCLEEYLEKEIIGKREVC